MFKFLQKLNPEYIAECGAWNWAWRTAIRKFTTKILKRDNRIRLPNGVWMDLPRDNCNASGIFIKRPYQDWGSEKILCDFLRPDADFFDIGAHIGYYALWAAPFCRQVYAFEPDERNIRHLQRNRKYAPNITIVPKAVTEEDVDTVLFDFSMEPSLNSLAQRVLADPSQNPKVREVPATNIDAFCAKNPHVNPCVIKVDIEGYDLPAVRGARKTISKFQPVFLIEFYEGPLNTVQHLFAFCDEYNYRVFAKVKPRRPDGSYSYTNIRFRELTHANWSQHWQIMIFLVPLRLHREFEKLVN